MRNHSLLIRSFAVLLVCSVSIGAQEPQGRLSDPCADWRYVGGGEDPPTISVTEVRNLPMCFGGEFVRIVGVYRIAFETCDLYDPTTGDRVAWVSLDRFYAAAKRCSSPGTLRRLDREEGGTFGLVALGTLQRGGGFGHMNSWPNEFQVICFETVADLSRSGSVIGSQEPKDRKRILEWYGRSKPR